jgi:membrane associated rhomboid family serine protease
MMQMPRFQGFVRTFVYICSATFLLQAFAHLGPTEGQQLYRQVVQFFGLVPELFFQGYIYQAFTWMFLHGDFMHLAFNMLAFWMFGSSLEEIWGTKRFIRYVFITGIWTGVLVAIWSLIDPSSYSIPTIGASGVVFAILIAISRIFPHQTVLVFFIFPMKMRYFAYLMIAIEFSALYNSNQHGVSNIAHLAGALVGFIYLSLMNQKGGTGSSSGRSWFKDFKDRWHQRRMRKRIRVIHIGESKRYH